MIDLMHNRLRKINKIKIEIEQNGHFFQFNDLRAKFSRTN